MTCCTQYETKRKSNTGTCHCRLINRINIHRILLGVSVCMWLENKVQIEALAVEVGADFFFFFGLALTVWEAFRLFMHACGLCCGFLVKNEKWESSCHWHATWDLFENLFIFSSFCVCVCAFSHCNICMILMFVWLTCTLAFDAQWKTTNAKNKYATFADAQKTVYNYSVW